MFAVRRLVGALLASGVLATAACGVAGTPSPAADGPTPSAPSTPVSPTRTTPVDQGDSALKTITLTWSTGSVPPPYNYTLSLTVTGENAKFIWETNYSANDRQWVGEFKLDASEVSTLVSSVNRILSVGWKDTNDMPVGGPSASYSVVTADASVREDRSALAGEVGVIESLITATVPKSVYSELEGEYHRWQKAQK